MISISQTIQVLLHTTGGAGSTLTSCTYHLPIADCSSVTAPTNGEVSQPSTTYESVATYTCNRGYTLNGDATRVCGDDGTWNGTTPTCQIPVQGLEHLHCLKALETWPYLAYFLLLERCYFF